MFDPDTIEGTDILRKELPEESQYWHKFHHISELHYVHIFDEEYNDYICCIDLMLTDYYNKYTIKLSLYNVSGKLSFDIINGFYSGFTIDDCSDRGYEKHCRFQIYSVEPDIEFHIYCEKIKAELVH